MDNVADDVADVVDPVAATVAAAVAAAGCDVDIAGGTGAEECGGGHQCNNSDCVCCGAGP